MKKSILFLALAFSAGNFATSCSSDRDEMVETAKYDIVGKWNAIEYQDGNGVWKDMSVLKWFSQFNADGTYQSYSGSNYSGTYIYDKKDHIIATVGGEKVHYIIKSMSGSDAIAEMYYESNPSDKVTYKLKR